MRSIVTKFAADTGNALAVIGMNKIGTIDGASCTQLQIDAASGESISQISLAYLPDNNVIGFVKATTSSGKVMQKGQLLAGMTTQVMKPQESRQIIGFWGYESARIASVAAVTADTTCIKGVTMVDSDNVDYIEIVSAQDEQTTENDNTTGIVLSAVAVGFGTLLHIVVICVGSVVLLALALVGCWIARRKCRSRAQSLKIKTEPTELTAQKSLNDSDLKPERQNKIVGKEKDIEVVDMEANDVS